MKHNRSKRCRITCIFCFTSFTSLCTIFNIWKRSQFNIRNIRMHYPDNIMTSKRRLKDVLKFLRRLFRVGFELRMKRIDCNIDAQCFEIVPFFQCAHELHERLRISERFPARSMRYATVGWVGLSVLRKMDAIRNDNKRLTVSIVTSMILLNKNDESSISSENKNDDNDDISVRDIRTLYCILMANKVRGKIIATEKITDYVERVIPNYLNIVTLITLYNFLSVWE